LTEEDLKAALHLTLLLYAHKKRQLQGTPAVVKPTAKNGSNNNNKRKSSLHKASEHWEPYLTTLPEDYSSLVFEWTPKEILNLKGTSCHALAQRLRWEVQNNWEQCFRGILVKYLQKEEGGNVDDNLLYTCYRNAVCGCYSRFHGISDTAIMGGGVNATSRSLCPLLDLFNGNRDTSSDVNIQVMRYPGTHVALSATRDIAAGEDLMIPYGDFSNQVFLTVFGFLPLTRHGNPQIVPLDAVYVLPPPSLTQTPVRSVSLPGPPASFLLPSQPSVALAAAQIVLERAGVSG
jgi:hypothetical protein